MPRTGRPPAITAEQNPPGQIFGQRQQSWSTSGPISAIKKLTGLKRLMELVEDDEGRLSVVLAGHPKLRNNLRRPTIEEIGYQTDIFSLDGIADSQPNIFTGCWTPARRAQSTCPLS